MTLSKTVSREELLGRYLLEESYFSSSKNAVKPKAFMPPLDLKLSVFRIHGLSRSEIWDIGDEKVAAIMGKTLKGVAEIKAEKVFNEELDINPNEPPTRHANITGWPEEKAKRQSIAQELAAEAKLVLK